LKNKTVYIFTQVFIGVISLTTFLAFTYPFLKTLGFTDNVVPIVVEDNSLKERLAELEASNKIVKREVNERETKVSERAVTQPRGAYSTRPDKKVLNKKVPEAFSETPLKSLSLGGNFGELKQGIETSPEVSKPIAVPIKVTPPDTLDNVERAFKITSNIVGTICPIFGLLITFLLWKSQKKKIDDERCVLFKD
jgi:hypothetical protein